MNADFARWGEPERKPAIAKYIWAVAALIAAGVIVFVALPRRIREKPKPAPLGGYQRDVAVLSLEYRKFHGKLLRDPDLENRFVEATDLVSRNNYGGAIEILEAASKEAAVPVVFNNLAALYAAMGDRARAIAAFREALARDADYRPVRDSIDRMKWFTEDEAAPVSKEIEPNNSNVDANLIGVGIPVAGEITLSDTDSFKFITPAAPRDIVQLEISNLTPTLALGLRVYDNELRSESGRVITAAGESLTRYIAQPPNTPLFLQVWGARDSVGEYRITLRAMKAFDSFEPNDDIFSAHKIELGQAVEANIMDSDDTDFYSFQSPRSGTVAIYIENRSSTLIPALTTFSSDKRNTGFAPDVRTGGANLRHTMAVQENQTYFLQVWSQASTSGKYTLTVR
jgi:tetratricopeptide (TPR) repeat protein